jgi:hypothetical protein
MEVEVDLADLWQAMSDVPKELGSTKPLSWLSASHPAVAGVELV